MVLKPLPYAQSEQLFNVFQAKPQDGVGGTGWSYPNFTELRDHNDVFSDMVGAQKHQLTLTGRGEPTGRRRIGASRQGLSPCSGRSLCQDAPSLRKTGIAVQPRL